MTPRKSLARLFVILARDASCGVVFRRGPATWTQLITWNTHNDTFERGQWFRGKVYLRRCDLSPSGTKLIYFVAKHHLQHVDPSYTRTWTAISKPPYFTALALWPNGGTTYHGGGLWDAENSVSVNSFKHRWSNPERGEPAQAHPEHVPPKALHISPIAFTSGEQLFVKRLVRDGWKQQSGKDLAEDILDFEGTLVREMKHRRLTLEVGYQVMRYALFERVAGAWQERPFEGVEWADFDQRGRLVFARDGKLYAAKTPEVRKELEVVLLADFQPGKPESVLAPPHARRW